MRPHLCRIWWRYRGTSWSFWSAFAPGETLAGDFLKPLGLSVPATRIGEIVQGRHSITAGTALRMARFFGISPQSWMNLQTYYNWEVAADASGRQIELQVHPRRAA